MDPLSISSGAAGLVSLGLQLLQVCSTVKDAEQADKGVKELTTVLEHLLSVLKEVETTFSSENKPQDPGLERHYDSIKPILESCGTSIYGLLLKLPKHKDDPALLRKAYDALKLELKKESVKTQLSYIQFYAQCLGLLLSSVTATNQWQIHASQNDTEAAIANLSNDVDSLKKGFYTFIGRKRQPSQTIAGIIDEDDYPDNMALEDDPATRSIKNYIDSTSDLAVKLAADSPGNSIQSAAVTTSTRPALDDDSSPFDPGFELLSYPPQNILEKQIKNYEEDIEKFRRVRLFDKAEHDLHQMKSLKKKLEEHYKVPFDNRQEVEITHARILYEKATVQSLDIAKSMVQQLIQQSKEMQERHILCHFLAAIYAKQGHFEKAKPYAETALNGRKSLGSNEDRLRESYLLLEQIHQNLREYPSARAYRELLETQPAVPDERTRTTPSEGSSPVSASRESIASVNLSTNVYAWLDTQGFDKRAQFPFGEPHPKSGKLPLQVAIESKNKEVVHELMQANVDVNVKDRHGATALLEAASTQDVEIVKMILAHVTDDTNPIDVNATDNAGNNALHRVTKRTGDTKCVELLLSADPPVNINHQNRNGRTPLHDAVEKGNIELTLALLKYPALDLDICDNAKDTACHLAVKENREQILLHLLNAGASVRLKNGDGHDLAKATGKSWKMHTSLENRVKLAKKAQQASTDRVFSMASEHPSTLPRGSRVGSTGADAVSPASSNSRSIVNDMQTTGETELEPSPRRTMSRWTLPRRRT